MKPSSAKAKGRRLQQLVRDHLLARFNGLTEDDVRSTPMGVAGDDIQLSSAAKSRIPYAFECKNQERVNVWDAIEQCRKRKREGDGSEAVVVIKKNAFDPHVILPFSHFLALIAAGEGGKGEGEAGPRGGEAEGSEEGACDGLLRDVVSLGERAALQLARSKAPP